MTGGVQTEQEIGETEVAEHLQRLLASDGLAKSATNRRLLTYLVERHARGADGPKEAEIAIDVFGRDASFHGGDDSVVRVAMRGLRQKLLEYYAGPGKEDRLVLDIPKGSYRLKAAWREPGSTAPERVIPFEAPLAAEALLPAVASAAPRRGAWYWAAAAICGLLLVSLAANVVLWGEREREREREDVDPALAQVRQSAVWQRIATSNRPVMIVLGDLFMYTQADPVTGRVQTVRDPQITSSDDLRAFIATNPSLAAARGLRYASYIQKSTAVGMATVIPVFSRPGRRIEVRLRDELRAEDLGRYDIIYIGPFSRTGPLDALVQGASRYRFDAATSGVEDISSGKIFLPEGELAQHRKDYALVTGFRGPQGSNVLIITAGGRNAGLGQVVQTVTTPQGLAAFDRKLREVGAHASGGFEALLSVDGYKQTDLSAEILTVRKLAALPVAASSK
jgi:hypothetical protein